MPKTNVAEIPIRGFTAPGDAFLENCFCDSTPSPRPALWIHPHKETLKGFCQQFRAIKHEATMNGGVQPTYRAAHRLFGLLWEATRDLPEPIASDGEVRTDGKGGLQIVWVLHEKPFIINISGSDSSEDSLSPNTNTDISHESLRHWLQGLTEVKNMVTTSTTQNNVITSPQNLVKRKTLGLRPGPKRQTYEEAMTATFAQYDQTMRVLAGLQDAVVR